MPKEASHQRRLLFSQGFAMTLVGFVLSCSVAVAASAGVTHLEWAGVEVVGAPPAFAQELKAAADLPIGVAIGSLDEGKRACESIRSKLRQLSTRGPDFDVACELVGYSGNSTYLVANVSPRTDAGPLKEPPGSSKLSSKLAKIALDFSSMRSAAVSGSMQFSESVDAEGILWTGVTSLDTYKRRFSADVLAQSAALVHCVATCAEPAERAASIELLNWIPFEPVAGKKVAGAIADEDPGVRNNASRYVRQRLSLLGNDEAVTSELARGAARQVLKPSHGDRNKGLFMLKELRLYDANSVSCSLQGIRGALETLKDSSILPNVRDEASTLLSWADEAEADPDLRCSDADPVSVH